MFFLLVYSMLGKKILKMTPPSIQKFNQEDTEKLAAIVAASEMMESILLNRKPYQNILTFKHSPKMASIAMLILGALANALAFTSSSYLFSRVSKGSID